MSSLYKSSFYVLYSPRLDKYYIGITTDDIEKRLHNHNTSFHGRHFTSSSNDWEVKLEIECDSYSIARKMELYVKRMKSRKFVEKIINSLEEQQRLIETVNKSI